MFKSKKNTILKSLVLLSLYSNGVCFAEQSDYLLSQGVYDDFIETNKSILISSSFNDNDAEYTFKKGAKIEVTPNQSGIVFNPISNQSYNQKPSHRLTVNVGSELNESDERYEFYLKPWNDSYDRVDGVAGVYISSSELSSINLTNTNMKIDLSKAADNTPSYRYTAGIFLDYGNLSINSNDSDINIFNNTNNIIGCGIYSSGLDSKLSINGTGNSNIDITGNFDYGIRGNGLSGYEDKTTELYIDGIKDLNIKLCGDSDKERVFDKYGISTVNEKVYINLDGNLNIGTVDKNALLNSGIRIAELLNDNVDFDLIAQGNIRIDNAVNGIVYNPFVNMTKNNKGTTDIDIKANSIYITAKEIEDFYDSGIGICVSNGHLMGRNVSFNIESTGTDGIRIEADNIGYFSGGDVMSELESKNGSININSDNRGIVSYYLGYNTDEDLDNNIDTIIKASDDINVYGQNVGIESILVKGKLELNAENINITSNGDALKLSHYSDWLDSLSINIYKTKGEISTKINADKDLLISGGNTGVSYATLNSGRADIVSESKNVYIFGENNGIYLDSMDIDGTAYEAAGNLAKHDINIGAGEGSVYIGYFGGDSKNTGNGILNSGRNNLNIEADELIRIQGSQAALDVRKETVNTIKGKNIIIGSDGIGVKSEGVNNVIIGYETTDEKKSDTVIISGNIGVDINANILGKYDVEKVINDIDFSDVVIDGETNKMDISADNIEINGNSVGLNISQAATAQNSDDNADIYEVWKNNVVNIQANGQMNIIAQNDTAINVDGINKVNIQNTSCNFISGKITGINLSLNSNLVKDGIDYENQVGEYIDKIVEDKIRENSGHSEYWWNLSKREIYMAECNEVVKDFGYSSLTEFYADLFINEDLQNQIGLTKEDLEILDPEGDPLIEIVLLDNPEWDRKYIESLLDKTNGDEYIEDIFKENNCKTEKEYFDKMLDSGYFTAINTNIDVKDHFVLETKKENIVLGGAKAFNMDGKLTAFVKGNINYFKSLSYREDDALNDIDKISNAVNISRYADFEVQGDANILEAGKIDEYSFGSETALNVVDNSQADIIAGIGGNRLSGAIFVDDNSTVNITTDGGNNFIYSSAHGKDTIGEGRNDIHVVSALYANSGSLVNINAGDTGISFIQTNTTLSKDAEDESERTVWAQNGGKININGRTEIVSSNSAIYTNGQKGNARGIAITAGTGIITETIDGEIHIIEDFRNENGLLADIQNTDRSTVTLNYNGNSVIEGDIVSGYGGLVTVDGGNITENGESVALNNSVKGSLYMEGNALAANGGKLNLDLGNGGTWYGRADNYGDAGYGKDATNHTNFYNPAFSNEIVEGGTVNITMNNGSKWVLTGQSWVSELNANDSIIDMAGTYISDENAALYDMSDTHALVVDNFKGDGSTFIMDLDSVNVGTSDMLYIKDNQGTFDVNLADALDEEALYARGELRFATIHGNMPDFGNGISIWEKPTVTYAGSLFSNVTYDVETEDFTKDDIDNTIYNEGEQTNVNAKAAADQDAGSFENGKPGQDYVNSVFEDGDINLLITGVAGRETGSIGQTIVDMSKANYTNAIYMDRLNKRMGETRFIDGDEGMWVRLRHDRVGKEDSFRSMNTMYEMGYDVKQEKDNGEHRIGFAIDYMDGSTDYSKLGGNGEISRKGIWMYDTWVGEKGHYRDIVAKWGHLSNDFDVYAVNGDNVTGDYSNNVYSISAEFGKKNNIGNNWYFEPQAQLQYAHVTGAEYMTSAGTAVNVDNINSLIARAGFRLGKDLGKRSTVYFKADLLHEFLGEQDVFAMDNSTGTSGVHERYDHDGTWCDLGFGFATAVGHNSYAYLDFEKSFGNDNNETYQINAGLQWSF